MPVPVRATVTVQADQLDAFHATAMSGHKNWLHVRTVLGLGKPAAIQTSSLTGTFTDEPLVFAAATACTHCGGGDVDTPTTVPDESLIHGSEHDDQSSNDCHDTPSAAAPIG